MPRGTMRPAVKRRLLTLAAAVSLFVCITTLSLWIGTLGREVTLYRGQVKQHTLRSDWFALGRGEFIWSSSTMRAAKPHADTTYIWRAEDSWENVWAFTSYGSGLRYLGFDFRSKDTGRERYWIIAIPCWSVALASSILPALMGSSLYLRHDRIAAGRCRKCGYDLRATPDCCPECGAVPAAR